MARCGPGYTKKNKTCYPDKSLLKMKEFWNLSYPNNKITANNVDGIWKQFHRKMKNTCDKENCWLEQPFMRGKIDNEMSEIFAPKQPASWKKKPNEWLTNVDITNVLKQYEKKYKCFCFLGPFPIDFDAKLGVSCVANEMCKFDLTYYINKKKHKIGFVFNTDPHDKDGEHWISLFINIKNSEIFFFDSAGDKIKPQIRTFVDRVIAQGKQVTPQINFIFDENAPFTHQRSSTECGMYSLYFLINMLQDKTDKNKLKTMRVPDSEMLEYRSIYFND